jgi:pimeloyl-ACP methyl ester carboxylesterase
MSLVFFLSLSLSLPLDQAPPPRLVGDPIELKIDAGTLHGTIDLPATPGPWPVVLLHPGSGPTDRNGNNPVMRNDSLKMLGRALAAEGIAVLRIDKRGIAASANAMSKEEDVRVEAFASDVAAWLARLRKDPRFTRIGFIGHSEGSFIGLLAAKDAKPDSFVSLCGAGRPFTDLLREQLKAGLPKDLLDASEKILVELEAGREVKDVPAKLKALFRPSVQPYLIGLFKHDPAKLAADFPGPHLVVSGSSDIQVPASDGKRLAGENPKAKWVTIEGMNHILKPVANTNRVVQVLTYTDPSLPLHPKLVPEVVAFLKESLGGK